MNTKTLALLLLVSACDSGSSDPTPVLQPTNTLIASAWEIGPILNGKNYSVDMPLHPIQEGRAISFDFPLKPGSVHYVTYRHGPINASAITMHYRIEAAPGVTFHPVKTPEAQPVISLYFQRKGDDWSGTGKYDSYRQYQIGGGEEITAGEHVLTANLTPDKWTGVMSLHPPGFTEAIANADRVGFVLGGGDGLGHGVYASGPAKLIVESFEVK